MTRPPNPQLVESLLAITTDLIAEKGAGKVTLREVAAKAGVTTTTIHYYFTDRQGLFEGAKLRAIGAMDAAVAASVTRDAGALEQIAQISESFAGWCIANPHGFALVFEALPPFTEPGDELPRRYYASFALLRAVFEAGVRSGELHVDDVDLAATVGFSTVFGVVHLYLNKRLPPQYWGDVSPVLQAALDAFLKTCAGASGVGRPLRLVGPAASAARPLSDESLADLAAAGPAEPPSRPDGIY
jgi:AcrR family transcriptional regulator